MLVEKIFADTFLVSYKALLKYRNDCVEPKNVNEYESVRTKMFENIDDLTDLKCEVTADFIESIKTGIFGKFIYLKNYKNGYVLFHIESNKYYRVLGLNSPINELVESFSVVRTAIILYNSIYICDGLVADLRVLVGKNMAEEVEANYYKAVELGEVLESA